MENKEIHVVDIGSGIKLKEEIENMIYDAQLPSYVIIAILEAIKYRLLSEEDEDE